MDINIIMQAISTLGFPIAVCCYLLWRLNKKDVEHKAEMDNIVAALNNNTLVLQKLIDRMDNKNAE